MKNIFQLSRTTEEEINIPRQVSYINNVESSKKHPRTCITS